HALFRGSFMKSQIRYAIICAPLLAALLLVPAGAQSRTQTGAQTGSLKGRVKERNGKALEGVIVNATEVENKEKKRETKSESRGGFGFDALRVGRYTLSFEKQGYKTFITRKLEVAAGETTNLSSAVELSREGEPYAVIRGAVFRGAGFTLPNAMLTIERIDGGKKLKQEAAPEERGGCAFRVGGGGGQ